MTNGGDADLAMGQAELRALEEQCVQECAPTCQAACPVHVDVRGVLRDLAAGEVDAALKTLRRTVPFPGIIGRICDQPCRPVCVRGRAGDPIEIAALERACEDYALVHGEKTRPLPRRTTRVAVVGGGLSGLTAAVDLARKGYPVTLYEQLSPVGGRAWSYPEERLPRPVIMADLATLATLPIEVRDHARVFGGGPDDAPLTLVGIRAAHDAVYVATGADGETFGLAKGPEGRVAVDPVTYATDQPGVFAGGSLLRGEATYSPITSIADGRRAGITIDRFLQGVSVTASRAGEGATESCLYTSIEGVEPAPAAPVGPNGYSAEEARREAGRCIQCECMECVKVCEYLEHYGRYPRKAIREIYNNLSIVKGSRYANRMINACSLCGLCAEVCPTDLDMGEIAAQARRTMVTQERMPPSAHDFALHDMAFSQGEAFSVARNAPGTDASDVVFFPGCQLAGATPEHVERVYRYLAEALPGRRVGLILGCCGAPAAWAGRVDLQVAAAADLRHTLKSMGDPEVVLACSSCHRELGETMPDVRIRSLWEVMAEHGLPEGAGAPAGDRVLSVHDACATRNEAGIQDAVRDLLGRLGYGVEELRRTRTTTTCCGYGGMQWLADPEVARKTVAKRVAEGEHDLVAYCAMCRDVFARGGKPTTHILDLVFGDDYAARAARPATGWSERHENRARTKRRMLGAIWGEPMDDIDAGEGPVLHIPDDVLATMEGRLVLVEDVRRVVAAAERTGRRIAMGDGGHYLASLRPVEVTYWVEYSVEEDVVHVHDAYSHRMQVQETLPDGGAKA
jgi:glutamate synthase (NADPH) small chain